MTNPPRSNKKKKFTIAATQQGVEIAEKALMRLGFDSKTNFAKTLLISRNTVTKFFNRQPIQLDTFKKVCKELKLNWREISGLEEKESNFSRINNCSSSEIDREVVPVQPIAVRQIAVIDETTQVIKAEITLKGDIHSVENLKTLELILRQYSGDTIKIKDIREGSIRLTVEGSPEEIDRLLSQLRSGEIREVDGFPVEDFQILSESAEDEENQEASDKWNLVREIVSRSIKNRNLRGADLSDADLRGACLRGADLSNADLQGAELSDADQQGSRELLNTAAYVIVAAAAYAMLPLLGEVSYILAPIANRQRTNLQGANLQGANLQGANLQGANLQGANLQGANVEETQFGNNIGISREMKANLIKRGAIFNDSPGSGDLVNIPVPR